MNTVEYLKKRGYNGLDDIQDMRQHFYHLFINVSYEDVVNNRRRLIFTTNQSNRHNRCNFLALECNGLVLEASAEGWRILVYPVSTSKASILNKDYKNVNTWLKSGVYDIYPIYDGTVCNLYYYNERWCISTTRGIEVDKNVYNTHTFENMLDMIFCCKNINIEEFYNYLDKNMCYTIGFTHPDMHPSGDSEHRFDIWSIQSVDLISYDTYVFSEIGQYVKAPERIEHDGSDFKELFTQLKTGLGDYLDGGNAKYGYILVSRDRLLTKNYPVILLESSLMRTIKKLFYNKKYNSIATQNGFDRVNVILLKAVVDNNGELFKRLFKTYSAEIDAVEKVIDDLYNRVYHFIISKEEYEGTVQYSNLESRDEAVVVLASHVLDKVGNVRNMENPMSAIRSTLNENVKTFNILYNQYMNSTN